MAADGYPGKPKKGTLVPAISDNADFHIHYAGVEKPKHPDKQNPAELVSSTGLVSSSGRVLVYETVAATPQAAQPKIYNTLDALNIVGFFHRHDIGAKAWESSYRTINNI